MISMLNEKLSHHYIAGIWQPGEGADLLSTNPMNGMTLWQGKAATFEEIETAWLAAYHASKPWEFLSVDERAAYLTKFAECVELKRSQFIEMISLESGKPRWEAATEVNAVINKISLSIQAYRERCTVKNLHTPEAEGYIRYKPHGIVAVLGAFNFPAHLSNGHIIPALLAGNTVIYKPSELTPGVGALIMQCWDESNLPAGVINCVQGNAETGEMLLSMDLQGVFFTGSYQTGKKIHRMFNERPEIILALEMGGNNPLIIDEITDVEAACYQIILSTLITAGQRCTCARRLFIKNNALGDALLSRLIQAFQKVHVGDPINKPEPFMGPVISSSLALKHLQSQEELLSLGGKSLLKMTLLQNNTGLLSPGIMDMTNALHFDEEIFAPFVQIYRYSTFTEAIHLANNTRYGLVAGLISENSSNYQLFYQKIRSGLINWNRPTTGASSSLPFGGVGCSGNNRPSAYFAADYCAYPIACLEQPKLLKPSKGLPGLDEINQVI